MHRITITRHPSARQVRYMAENMRDRLKTHATIQSLVYAFKSGRTETSYWISVPGKQSIVRTWEGLQSKYRELMGRKI